MSDPIGVEFSVLPEFDSDRYRLISKIGEGGFGQVFLAEQLRSRQNVAIKLLTINPDFDEDKKRLYIQRFDRETLIGGRLEHPNIVRLIDKGKCDDELVYAVFEFIRGRSLKEKIQESGPLLPTETVDIMGQVLSGLAHAHEQGVIHRDIKPANIMLTRSAGKLRAKILDFGIGTLMHEARQLDYKSLTLTHETLGTPSYSAPEQLRGEPPTPKTDLYVWGLVFIECLTGRPAVSGANLASVFHKQLSQTNVPIPAGLVGHPASKLLRRVLNKKIGERADSAQEILEQLKQLNFSTLVGDLSLNRTAPNLSVAYEQGCDETVINEDNIVATGLSQRKQISVLCLTLTVKASTNEAVDHEVVDALYRDKKSSCSDIAIRYGAMHVGTLGDTQLFYFGYPAASDNDSRLCARTALEMISDLTKRNSILKYSQGIFIEARIGIHTGMVTTYSDSIPEGDAANIAMELSRMALPNQILCSEKTRRVLDSHIEFEPSQSKTLGVDRLETPVFLMTGERHVEAFGFLRANRQHQVFVGRQLELSQIHEFVGEACGSNFLHAYGEAGIGKSRLVYEFRSHTHHANQFVSQCLPEYKNNALYPVLQLVKYKYSLDAVSPEKAVAQFSSVLECDRALREDTISLLCAWLNISIESPADLTLLDQKKQKELLFNALAVLLIHKLDTEQHAQHIFIFEDTHWADPTTHEFLVYFSENILGKTHKIVATSRHALDDTGSKVAICLRVPKLRQEDTQAFIESLFDEQQISPDVLAVLIERTDGIPLFIEELVGMLNNKKLVQKINGVVSFTGPESLRDVPMSLRDSLQQRLDSLVYAKETVQLAATIGREFNDDLLKAASSRSEAQVQADLMELIDADLIFTRRQIAGDQYIFKHALVRDAAYDSLTSESHRSLHHSIALSMEELNEKSPDYEDAIVAMHFQHAGEHFKSSSYWRNSAQTSIRRADNTQALSYLHHAIDDISQVPKSEASINREIEIRNLLGTAYSATHGYASKEVTENQSHIRTLISYLENPSEMFTVLWVSAINQIVGANYEPAQKVVDELVQLSDKLGDAEKILPAYLMNIGIDWHQGKFTDAKKFGEKALNLYDFDRHHHLVQTYTYDPGVAIMIVHALVVWVLDDKQVASEWCSKALMFSRRDPHPSDLAHTLVRSSQVAVLNRDYEQTVTWASEAFELSCEHDLGLWQASSQVIRGWGKSGLGENTIEETQSGFDALFNTGTKAHLSWYQTLLAEVYFNEGQLEQALSLTDEAIILAEKSNDALYLVETYRLKCQILARDKNTSNNELVRLCVKMLNLLIAQNALGFVENIVVMFDGMSQSISEDDSVRQLLLQVRSSLPSLEI